LSRSIFFALPTMATSNAMLRRVEEVGARLFEPPVNLVLAHGKRRANEAFDALVRASFNQSRSSYDAEV